MKVEFKTDDPIRVKEVRSFIDEWNNTMDFVESKTSGSTGTPKTIRLQKKHMIASAKMTGTFLNLKPQNTALLCMSVDSIAGKMMIVRAIVLDLVLIVSDKTSSPLKKVRQKIDFAAMVPLQVEGSMNNIAQIETLIVGGGVISNRLWNAISESDVNAYQTFGMTETISHIAMREISFDSTNYKLLPGIDIRVVDNCMQVNAFELGVCNLQTNDFITIAKDGSFNWLGRKDFVVNSGGVKIHPEQVEEILENLISLPFFVTGLPDDHFGEKLILCIEGEIELLKNDLSIYLKKYQTPREIYFFEKFNKTQSGKVNRVKTLERIGNAKKQVL